MAKSPTFHFSSKAPANALAAGWRQAIVDTRGGALMTALRGKIEFGQPPSSSGDTDPFVANEPEPVFSAYADIPLGRANAQSALIGLYLYADGGGGLVGRIVAISGGLGTSAHKKYFSAAVDGVRRADPDLQEM